MPSKSQKSKSAALPVTAVVSEQSAPAKGKKKGRKGPATSVAPAEQVEVPQQQPQETKEQKQQEETGSVTKPVGNEPAELKTRAKKVAVGLEVLEGNAVLNRVTQQWAERAATALLAIAAREDSERSLLFADERLVRLEVEHSVGHLLPRRQLDIFAKLPYPRHNQRVSSGLVIVRDEETKLKIEAMNIPGVTKVINYRTYHATYNTPELVQSLISAHEVFMADLRVLPVLTVGAMVHRARDVFFVDCHRTPSSTKASISSAFISTKIPVDARKPAVRAIIGRSDATPQQLADNAMAVLERLCMRLPLGWRAIRAARIVLDGTDAPPLPIYHRPDDVDAAQRNEASALESQKQEEHLEAMKRQRLQRRQVEEEKKRLRDNLRLVHSRWEAFRKAPHLFGEAPPPLPEELEAAEGETRNADATKSVAPDAIAEPTDTATTHNAEEPPAKKRKKGSKKPVA